MKNETIKEAMKHLKGFVMDAVYGEGDDDDFDAIVGINDMLKIIEMEVTEIEKRADKAHELGLKVLELRRESSKDTTGIK